MTRLPLLLAALVAVTAPLAAQSTAPRHPRLEGTWQAKTEDEIRNITVRTDSSAQFGEQVARWRVAGDSLWITAGDGASRLGGHPAAPAADRAGLGLADLPPQRQLATQRTLPMRQPSGVFVK